MRLAWPRVRGAFAGRVGAALPWVVALMVLAAMVNLAGIHLLGGIEHWQRWMAASARYFLFWRLCLYGAIVCGWQWMRWRLLARERDTDARRRLMRAEAASVAALVTLECALWLQGGATP